MNIRHAVMCLWAGILPAALSQPPPGPLTDGPPGRERFERFADEADPASPMGRWMHHLREENPAEFQRLQQLRHRDPPAFRSEAGDRLQEDLMNRLRDQRPRIHEALTGLPEEDRRWLMEQVARRGMNPPPPHAHGSGSREEPGKDRETIAPLIRAYHEGSSPDAKKEALQRLEEEIGRMYDRRLEERRQQLQEVERKLEELRHILQQGEEEKDSFVAEKISAMLERSGRGPGPRPPRQGDPAPSSR